jgi:hypothetical protein
LFVVLLFVVGRKCFSTSVNSGVSKDISVASRAAIAGAVALLAAGAFDYTWYNFRIFFIFWALLGIACAAVDLHEEENADFTVSDCDEYSYSLTVSIPKTKAVNESERKENRDE